MDRLPSWLREVLTIELARRWRALAAGSHGEPVIAGQAALVVHLRHRVCEEFVFASDGDPLLREPAVVCGLPVACLDDAVVAVLAELPGLPPKRLAVALDDLATVERLTPLRMEEGLILLGLAYAQVDPADVLAALTGAYWERRLPELRASLETRGYVYRAAYGSSGARALTIGTGGQVWVPPHQRDGRDVAGYWRRR